MYFRLCIVNMVLPTCIHVLKYILDIRRVIIYFWVFIHRCYAYKEINMCHYILPYRALYMYTCTYCTFMHSYTYIHPWTYDTYIHTCLYTYIRTQRKKKDFLTLGNACKMRGVLLLFAGKFNEGTSFFD